MQNSRIDGDDQSTMVAIFKTLNAYFGDLHNHCGVGYGHGTLDDAFANARLQLDFVCMTAHAHWGDLPEKEPRLADVVAYHRQGFAETAREWGQVQDYVEAAHEDGRFVTFLGYEWHSLTDGDHCIYYKEARGDIIRAAALEDIRHELRRLRAEGRAAFLIPHHISYRQGYRGINWNTFTPEFSPLVEIFSMHGAAESDTTAYPYLHTMGPRDHRSTYHYGLSRGHIVGVMGSTDHHSAHPGSYGHGRLGVWAEALTRDSLWNALANRRTVALTGDNIQLKFSINGKPLGSVLPHVRQRQIEVEVLGCDVIDYVEILYNNQVIHRADASLIASHHRSEAVKIGIELGWGEQNCDVDWDGEIWLDGGTLVAVEPHLRGHSIVAPQADEQQRYQFSSWSRSGANRIRFRTRTWGNPTTVTPNTQGFCLDVKGGTETRLCASFNGQAVEVTLGELLEGARAGYLGGFLTPAYQFHRAVTPAEYTSRISLLHDSDGDRRDWYTVRVRQKNNQWAWSSPIWIEEANI
jgi:hypothetical protein